MLPAHEACSGRVLPESIAQQQWACQRFRHHGVGRAEDAVSDSRRQGGARMPFENLQLLVLPGLGPLCCTRTPLAVALRHLVRGVWNDLHPTQPLKYSLNTEPRIFRGLSVRRPTSVSLVARRDVSETASALVLAKERRTYCADSGARGFSCSLPVHHPAELVSPE